MLIFSTISLGADAVTANDATQIEVVYFASSEASADAILSGHIGEVYIIYHLSSTDVEHPSVVVHIINQVSTRSAKAFVYDTPSELTHVPIKFVNNYPTLPYDLKPTISMIAQNGWWVRDSVVNYNLDITVFGQTHSMWGAGSTKWTELLKSDEPNAQIIVRDTDQDGLPDWDWRTMLPEFPNRGDYRTNYAESKCNTPVEIDLGVSPAWPFIAHSGGFELKPGEFHPPIVVDWETGQIKYFSELVTVRNQNCSYSFYSIQRVLSGRLNSPNFETPFAFYDLSGEGVGYPNLLLRTQRTIENEPLLRTANPETQSIRYSWRNQVGDWEWDYKVEVLGQYSYNDQTPIGSGMILIDAPPYETFPNWVIDRQWPVISFVARETPRYRSNEGIYEWSPLNLGDDFFFGWQSSPNRKQFTDITTGLRGEYRLHTHQHSILYMSPIDNRLHLKWAERGIWRLDDEQIIRVTNLNEDEFIDVWSREAMVQVPQSDGDHSMSASSVIEVLYALEDHFIYTGDSTLVLVASDYKPLLFETLPPTDHDTWETHRAQLAPYEAQRRDPTDLHSWLVAFSGPRSDIAGAALANLRFTDDGFRFELSLEPDYQVTRPDLLDLAGLSSGDYVVENNDGVFNVTPLVPANLSLDVHPLTQGDGASVAQVLVHNAGTADALGLTLVAEVGDGAILLTRESVDALAEETVPVLLSIPSASAGSDLRVWLEDESGQVLETAAPVRISETTTVDRDAVFTVAQVPVLIPVVFLFATFVAQTALRVVARRDEMV